MVYDNTTLIIRKKNVLLTQECPVAHDLAEEHLTYVR